MRRHHPANCDVEDIRRLVVRMGLTGTDALVWMGMLRQILWRISQGLSGSLPNDSDYTFMHDTSLYFGGGR